MGKVGSRSAFDVASEMEASETLARSDRQLLSELRAGDMNAFDELYRRNSRAAHSVARRFSRSEYDAEDLVAEAFVEVLKTIQGGKGPTGDTFRAYLLTVVRHKAYDRSKRDRRQVMLEDMESVTPAVEFVDPAVREHERTSVLSALQRLPERWQQVLWYTEVEGLKPADFAVRLGISANTAAALAMRARKGFRQAYLQAQIAVAATDACREFLECLAGYVRNTLSSRDRGPLDEHLPTCARCRAILDELTEINSGLRAGAILVVLRFPSTSLGKYSLPAAPHSATTALSTATGAKVRLAGRVWWGRHSSGFARAAANGAVRTKTLVAGTVAASTLVGGTVLTVLASGSAHGRLGIVAGPAGHSGRQGSSEIRAVGRNMPPARPSAGPSSITSGSTTVVTPTSVRQGNSHPPSATARRIPAAPSTSPSISPSSSYGSSSSLAGRPSGTPAPSTGVTGSPQIGLPSPASSTPLPPATSCPGVAVVLPVLGSACVPLSALPQGHLDDPRHHA